MSQKTRRFAPTLRADGSLDASCLAEMGERWVLSWLRERLSDADPYFPLDPRSGEDPDTMIVGLLRSAGPLDQASRLIGRACVGLLREAEAEAPQPCIFLGSLLRLCQQVRLPDTIGWFGTFIMGLAADPPAMEQRWSTSLLEIIYAAIQQAPDGPGSSTHSAWLNLLGIPHYSTQALIALSPSFEAEVQYLPSWWAACPPTERPRELRQRITRAAKLEGPQRLREILLATWPALPQGLQIAINLVLGTSGTAQIHTNEDTSRDRAIRNAARRPELVVSEETRRHNALCRL